VGGGRVGASLALDLAALEPPVGVIDPSPVPELDGVEGVDGVFVGPPDDAVAGGAARAPTVVFAVPDDLLAEAAGHWARCAKSAPAFRPAVALHTSGFHPAEILAPLRDVGAALASWHPVLAVSRPAPGRFAGATVTVEGDPAAVREAHRLATLVAARPREIPTEAKVRHHAAAVLASGHLVACLAAAARIGGDASGSGGELADLVALARSALDGVEASGLAAGLTGPVARGDADTIRAHLRALDPATRDLYRALGREALRAVAGVLPEAAAERVRVSLHPGEDEDGLLEGGSVDGQ
jgi:predicted short-subunit dehydrogenase-like oxidoreductase (DUF2520 family)